MHVLGAGNINMENCHIPIGRFWKFSMKFFTFVLITPARYKQFKSIGGFNYA